MLDVECAPEALPGTPEQLFGEHITRLVTEMTDLVCLASDPEQRPLFEREWAGLIRILLNSQLIISRLQNKDVEVVMRLLSVMDGYGPTYVHKVKRPRLVNAS